MEKTLARAIYKKMIIGETYTTTQLRNLIGDDYYKYVPLAMHPGQPAGQPGARVVAREMWKTVKAGYVRTYTGEETLPLVRGLRFGSKPTSYQTYTVRYWVRLK